MNELISSVCILADPRELGASRPVWGTGGWLPPDERRALDWLTLCRLMGLRAEVIAACELRASRISSATRWLVVACGHALIDHAVVHQLRAAMDASPLLLVCQAGGAGHPLAEWLGLDLGLEQTTGNRLRWRGNPSVECAKPLTLPCLRGSADARPVAWLDEEPIAYETNEGRGKAVVTAFDASELRDHDGAGGALLAGLFSICATHAHATLHWQGVLIPRMDDPGSSEALHHRIYHHTCLDRPQWRDIAEVLRDRHARMSVGYVSGWVDSGDKEGTLLLDGNETARETGKVHPSPRVCFECRQDGRTASYDHREEYHALQDLRREGLLEVEVHGHTHIFPDRSAWLAAPDRFDNRNWFREFGQAAADYLDVHSELPHPLDEALAAFREYFDCIPSTLICPGEVFTQRVLVKALGCGLMQVSSYYLAFRHHDRLCWAQHVCAPYLDQPDPGWFSSGLPVVGCLHDFDIALHGTGWLAECLDRWKDAGCRRIIGLDDLNALLQLRMELAETPRGWLLQLRSDPAWPLPRSFELMLHFPGRGIPQTIEMTIDDMAVAEQAIVPLSDDLALLEIAR